MKLKVCGMKHPQNITEVAALMPDYMGFIFYTGSPRFAGHNPGEIINDHIPEAISTVGVFVNETPEKVLKTAVQYKLSAVQLHGNESPELCACLHQQSVTVIKAFGVDNHFNFNQLNAYKPHCDYFLFDTKTKQYGGSGNKFNWTLLRQYDNEKPVFLSGGISPEDADAIQNLDINIHAIDINSRFETAPGIKDVEKITAFLKKIRSSS